MRQIKRSFLGKQKNLIEKERSGPLFYISAGDPSGDVYGCALVMELKNLFPESFFIGLGGPRMKEAGVHLLAPSERLATVGFTEIVRDIPFFYNLLKRSEDIFEHVPPDLVILIDYPGFNLRLAERARKRNMKVLFYISPQIWAWRERRYRNLIRDSDEIAVILPFEVDIFREWGKEVNYVGHPIFREIERREPRESFMKRYDLSPDRPILGLSPGSRRKEINYHLPVFLKVVDMVKKASPDVQILINRAHIISEREMRDIYLRGHDDIRVINESHHTSIDVSDLFLTKSGTSTLEAALLHTPLIVCYRMSQISYLIAKSMVRVKHISLVNILANREVVPEYIQHEFTPERIFHAVMELLVDQALRNKMISGLKEVSGLLEGENASSKVAELAVSMIGNEDWI
jgi:lipid-A-disaccharide synthase